MCEIKSHEWSVVVLAGMAFLHYPLDIYGYGLDMGIILVADDNRQASLIEKAFADALDAVIVPKLSKKMQKPNNYEMAVHCLSKYDKDETIVDFLCQKDFLPVVITGGIIPEDLIDCGYALRVKTIEKEIRIFRDVFQYMKRSIIKNLDLFTHELKLLESSRIFKKYEEFIEKSRFILAAIAVGKGWAMVFRANNSEEDVEAWLEKFVLSAIDAVDNMDEFSCSDSIEMAVKECIFDFFYTQKVVVDNIRKPEYTGSVADVVFEDIDFYYFPEPLLEKICAPLIKSVSFRQLKREMKSSGMLECNSTVNNYTVKLTYVDVESGRSSRKRFIKIRRELLETEEGLSLEDLVMLQNEESCSNMEKAKENRLCIGQELEN